MKRIFALLALLAFAPSVQADKHGNADISHSGEFRVRYKNDTDKDSVSDSGVGTEGKVQTRFTLGTTFRMGEKLTAHMKLQHTAQMGDNTATSATNDNASYDATHRDTTDDDLIWVQEAFATWMTSDEMSLKIGRFGYEIADGSVMSISDYQQNPNAFEGLVLGYDTEFANFDLLAFKHRDATAGTPDARDDDESNLYGLNVDIKAVPDALKMVNVHVIQQNSDERAGATPADGRISALRYGLTIGGDTMGIDYKGTYAAYSGTDRVTATDTDTDLTGSMMDFAFGYTFTDIMNLRIGLVYHSDSGDSDGSDDKEEEYKSFYYDSHRYSGLQDAIFWGNLTETAVVVSLDPMDKLSVHLGYHIFTATDDEATNTTAGGLTRSSGDADLGTEMDIGLKKKYEDNLEIAFRYSTFTPGAGFDPEEDTYTQIYLEGKAGF